MKHVQFFQAHLFQAVPQNAVQMTNTLGRLTQCAPPDVWSEGRADHLSKSWTLLLLSLTHGCDCLRDPRHVIADTHVHTGVAESRKVNTHWVAESRLIHTGVAESRKVNTHWVAESRLIHTG